MGIGHPLDIMVYSLDIRRRFAIGCFLFAITTAPTVPAAPARVPLEKQPKPQQTATIQGDLQAVLVYREGLRSVLNYAASQTNLFPATKLREARLLRREDKEKVWNTWKSYLDYMVALESIYDRNRSFYFLSGDNRNDAFLARYAAFLAQYRFALGVVERLDHDPGFDTLLNEPVPEIGLPANSFAQMKLRFLHLKSASEYTAFGVLNKTMNIKRAPKVGAAIKEDEEKIWAGSARGEMLTVKNALQVAKQSGSSAWLPVQTGIAEWMGDTKVWRKNKSLISEPQVKSIIPRLAPGDILIVRHEWYLSNIGLPGFWPHAALYIGTPEERAKFFAHDPGVQAWVKGQGNASGDLEALLRDRYPAACQTCVRPHHGHPPRVLEAISEGVAFTALEHAADADSMVVLRPRLSKVEKAQALVRAFHYSGRPYDFNFDFATDATLVCSELVYKAYEPATGMKGLNLPLVEVLGRKTLPPNEIVRQFDTDLGKAAQQFDFVLFLDGYERIAQALEVGVEAFRTSWKRPKWHILVQDTPASIKKP
jgi:hypothetical protein